MISINKTMEQVFIDIKFDNPFLFGIRSLVFQVLIFGIFDKRGSQIQEHFGMFVFQPNHSDKLLKTSWENSK
jgi:hypothetical protein